jgi:hypothetical protein
MLVYLRKGFFTEKEQVILEYGDIFVSLFRYDSGVEALHVRNKRGEIILLPYQGQQIWNCVFDKRDITMKSMFHEPVDTQEYLATYGGFLLHCGATAMGVPSREDTHPLHGELPNARYQEAYIVCGEDESGRYVSIGGRYRHIIAFNHHYLAEPAVKIYDSSALLDVSMRITNLKKTEMELMYMAHLNFRPVDNAELIYSADYTPESVEFNINIPKHIKTSVPIEDFKEYLFKLHENPVLHHRINAEALFDPEVVAKIRYKADENGMAHSVQVHPDGYADYAGHNITQLDQALRWIARTPDQDAMGLVLPSNTGNGGYLAEKSAGNIKTVAPGETVCFNLKVGLLSPNETEVMIQKIQDIKKGVVKNDQ